MDTSRTSLTTSFSRTLLLIMLPWELFCSNSSTVLSDTLKPLFHSTSPQESSVLTSLPLTSQVKTLALITSNSLVSLLRMSPPSAEWLTSLIQTLSSYSSMQPGMEVTTSLLFKPRLVSQHSNGKHSWTPQSL